ncbi:hypothetical protein [Streptomyces sp. NPDC001123]
MAAHHRHSVTSGAGMSAGTGTASSSVPARPAAAFAAVDSSFFRRFSLACHHSCWHFQQRPRFFAAASGVTIAVYPQSG